MNSRNLTKIILLIGLILMLVLSSCSSGASTANTNSEASTSQLPAQTDSFNVLAEAKVVPVNDSTLSFGAAGVVSEILVNEGDTVEENQPLARLAGFQRYQANVTSADLSLLQAQQALDALYENAELEKANAELNLAKARIALDDAIEERQKKNYQRASESTLNGIQADLILAQKAYDDAEEIYKTVQNRSETDEARASALSALSSAKKNLDRAQNNLNYALGLPDEQEVQEADANVSVAQATYNSAKQKLDDLADGPDPDEIALAESRLKNAQAQLDSAIASLDDIELKAPFSGVIVASNLKKGEYINPGVEALQIGNLSEWQVETTDLTELNILDIKVGQSVKVTFDAIPNLELTGKVLSIKQLGENKQGDITYTIRIKLDKQDKRLLWNMTAFVIFE